MRVHASQINPNAQLNALCAVKKAAAKREAERTRKKLLDFASKLDGESDSCVVGLGANEEYREQAKEQNQQNEESRKKQKGRADPEDADNSISDWA